MGVILCFIIHPKSTDRLPLRLFVQTLCGPSEAWTTFYGSRFREASCAGLKVSMSPFRGGPVAPLRRDDIESRYSVVPYIYISKDLPRKNFCTGTTKPHLLPQRAVSFCCRLGVRSRRPSFHHCLLFCIRDVSVALL